MRKITFLYVLIISLLFSSCRKDREPAYWDTDLLLPLVNASMGVNNILPDSILKTNADSSLKIVFSNELYKINIDTLFKLTDTTIHESFPPFPFTFNPGQGIPASTSTTTYALNGVQLKTVIIKSGFVKFKIKSKIQAETDFSYSIPCAKKDGVPFSINISVPASTGSSPGVYDQTFDLSGYTIDLTGPTGTKINTIYTSISAKISSSAIGPVAVMPSDIIIDNTFFDIKPYYAKGYFGNNTYTIGPDQTDFTLFDRFVDGSLQFEKVDLKLKINNPIGMDARLYLNNISSVNTKSNNTINLSNSIIGNPININRASESFGNVYPTYANLPLNTSNSNIKPMIENLPNKLGYSIQLITNPLGNISGSNDFIYADKLLKTTLEMEIPLSLMASQLTLADTLDLNISQTKKTQNINEGTITMFAENGFPFDAQVQMYLLNESNSIADSIFSYPSSIQAASVNSSLRATEKKLTSIKIHISESKMDLLYQTKKVVLQVKFNTSLQPQYIKIYSDYIFNIKLVGDFNYSMHLK